jgi:dynein heavy chain, axonemal
MLQTLLLTGGSAGDAGDRSAEEAAVARMVADIMNRLPAAFDIEKAQLKYPVLYEESMNQVLCQEMLRYNKLTSIIRTSLKGLDKALQGLQVMSAELEGVYKAMVIGAVPALWKAKSFPSLKSLSGYVDELLARLNMLQTWYMDGQPPCYWISGFFFTPAFTTASLQNFARKNKLPIDAVAFDMEMLTTAPEAITEAPADGIYIHGLYLEGCGWSMNDMMLCESLPKQLYCPAPAIWLKPKEMKDLTTYPHYSTPVYRTADRRGILATTGHSTNFLMFIRMPSEKPEEHWTMRGVCMLSSLPD